MNKVDIIENLKEGLALAQECASCDDDKYYMLKGWIQGLINYYERDRINVLESVVEDYD